MLRRSLHRAVRWFQRVRRLIWFFTNPHTLGVHGIAITPDGKVVLVTLSYEDGWRIPGGGRHPGEAAERAVLRELREEIGMTSHGNVRKVADFRHRTNFKNDEAALFVVQDVEYRPKWTLEVAAVQEFELDRLPADTSAATRRMIAAAAGMLPVRL